MNRRMDTWRNGCFGTMDDRPVHTTPNHNYPPKIDFLSKLFFKSSLLLNGYCSSSTCPLTVATTFCLLFCLILLLWKGEICPYWWRMLARWEEEPRCHQAGRSGSRGSASGPAQRRGCCCWHRSSSCSDQSWPESHCSWTQDSSQAGAERNVQYYIS